MAHFIRGTFLKTHGLKNISPITISRRMASSDTIVPSNFQKKVLVWTNFYPNIESIPNTVSESKMRKATDLFRVKTSIVMLIATVGGIIGAIMYGKKLRSDGDSLMRRGLEQMQEFKDAKLAEDAKKLENAKK